MVLRQPEKWPAPWFNASKTRVADLKYHLLNSGFTKEAQAVENMEEEEATQLGADNNGVSHMSIMAAPSC
jgi:hypothetical protein